MAVFQSKIATGSDTFNKNREEMLVLIDQLQKLNARAGEISEQRKPRFDKRGQLTPRERLARLLDPGMPWLAISNLAGYLLDTDDPEKSIPGSTIIAGIGFIKGVRCVVVVDDSGIQAGTLTTAGGYRTTRAQEISLEQKLPFVHLVESAGGDLLNYTVENFSNGGELFANLAKLSKAGIPTIAILHGSSTAGGAYMPGMSDYVIGVKNNGRAFLAGPPLLKAATGEIATEEELGGAEMHASVSGLVEYLAEDDGHAVQICRDLVYHLQWNKGCPKPELASLKSFEEPLYSTDELAGLIPCDYRTPYDMREMMARIVDGSDILDFKPRFGVSTVCLQAEIHGHAVGILGNNGPIDPQGANKATQFMQLCEQSDIPVIFMQNTTGYIVGTKSEQDGMIKHGSKMIATVRNLEVPRITLMTGASFGAGNYGMCGRGFFPDFLLSFPNAKTGVMGGEQAGKTMGIVARGRITAKGAEIDEATEEMVQQQEAFLAEHFDKQSSAFYTSGHCMDDGVIDPRDARKTLGFLLDTIWEGRNRTVKKNSFGVARF